MNDETKAPKVSRQEALLYGEMAPIVRLVGNTAEMAERALQRVTENLNGSREADGVTGGERDSQGRSKYSAYLEDEVFKPLYEVSKAAHQQYREIAASAAQIYREFREGVDSVESTPPSPPDLRSSAEEHVAPSDPRSKPSHFASS